MQIRFLGSHHAETDRARLVSFLVDHKIAFDAGALTSTLTYDEQAKIDAVFISHYHFDHLRDIPTLALGRLGSGKELRVYASIETLDVLTRHFLNDQVYPDFTKLPSSSQPLVRLIPIVPGQQMEAEGLQVTPLEVQHVQGSVGYHVRSGNGHGFFYTGDMDGSNLTNILMATDPDVLIVEVTFDDSQSDLANVTNHVTPKILDSELRRLLDAGRAVPEVVVTHMNPRAERRIARELEGIGNRLGARIVLAFEGMLKEI